MDPLEAIPYLAKQESRGYTFCKEESDVFPNLPYLQIYKTYNGKYDVKGHNHIGHDNEPRMRFMQNYLKTYVLPNMQPEIDASGFYNIELHDSYSYLQNGKSYKNCLTFSRSLNDHQGILLPDVYHLCNFGGLLSLQDPYPWDTKMDKIGFFGTTTGDRNPLKNERLKACQWGIDHRDIADIYITKVAQMSQASIEAAFPTAGMMFHPPVAEVHQYQYKYLLNIRGNTCCWNRLPMILNSKSLCFNMPCDDICFYYPLLQPYTHFVPVTYDSLASNVQYYRNNPKEADLISHNANTFVNRYLRGNQAMLYMVNLFEGLANQRP